MGAEIKFGMAGGLQQYGGMSTAQNNMDNMGLLAMYLQWGESCGNILNELVFSPGKHYKMGHII